MRLLASNKVVAASASVGDESVQVALGVEDDAVGTRGATGVNGARRKDGELVPGLGGRETEALVVVVLVGVFVGANLGAGLVVRVTLGKSGADGRGGVADGAAGVLASLRSEVGGGGLNSGDGSLGGSGRDGGAGDGDDGEEGDEGGEKLDHFDGCFGVVGFGRMR